MDSVLLLPANETEAHPTKRNLTPDPYAEDGGVEPDVWSKRAIYFGMAIGVLLIAEAFWPVLGLGGLMVSIDLPASLAILVRALVFLVGAYTILRGTISLANWYSGFRVYRNWKI